MSSPLKRHTTAFAGGVKNLLYRIYAQGHHFSIHSSFSSILCYRNIHHQPTLFTSIIFPFYHVTKVNYAETELRSEITNQRSLSGVTSPQLIESVGRRQTDDDYCKSVKIPGKKDHFCLNGGKCYSMNEGPKCDCSFTEFQGQRCEQGNWNLNWR